MDSSSKPIPSKPRLLGTSPKPPRQKDFGQTSQPPRDFRVASPRTRNASAIAIRQQQAQPAAAASLPPVQLGTPIAPRTGAANPAVLLTAVVEPYEDSVIFEGVAEPEPPSYIEVHPGIHMRAAIRDLLSLLSQPQKRKGERADTGQLQQLLQVVEGSASTLAQRGQSFTEFFDSELNHQLDKLVLFRGDLREVGKNLAMLRSYTDESNRSVASRYLTTGLANGVHTRLQAVEAAQIRPTSPVRRAFKSIARSESPQPLEKVASQRDRVWAGLSEQVDGLCEVAEPDEVASALGALARPVPNRRSLQPAALHDALRGHVADDLLARPDHQLVMFARSLINSASILTPGDETLGVVRDVLVDVLALRGGGLQDLADQLRNIAFGPSAEDLRTRALAAEQEKATIAAQGRERLRVWAERQVEGLTFGALADYNTAVVSISARFPHQNEAEAFRIAVKKELANRADRPVKDAVVRDFQFLMENARQDRVASTVAQSYARLNTHVRALLGHGSHLDAFASIFDALATHAQTEAGKNEVEWFLQRLPASELNKFANARASGRRTEGEHVSLVELANAASAVRAQVYENCVAALNQVTRHLQLGAPDDAAAALANVIARTAPLYGHLLALGMSPEFSEDGSPLDALAEAHQSMRVALDRVDASFFREMEEADFRSVQQAFRTTGITVASFSAELEDRAALLIDRQVSDTLDAVGLARTAAGNYRQQVVALYRALTEEARQVVFVGGGPEGDHLELVIAELALRHRVDTAPNVKTLFECLSDDDLEEIVGAPRSARVIPEMHASLMQVAQDVWEAR